MLGSKVWLAGAVCLGALGLCSTALAQSEAWHFGSDASRHARVDDRGGLGEGYSFSIDYDPADGNSEDFCPHCRLTLMVSDPGLDLSALQTLGVERGDIASAASFLSTLQGLTAADPTGLAMELQPGLSAGDLAAFAARIEVIQTQLGAVVTALETFAALQSGFDWSSASLASLVSSLSLRMDTAFRGDFSDINDPRIHNSGVAVYGLPELLSGLAGVGVDMSTQMQIQSVLSAIPGLSGALEISGDDDDVLAPASFHGYHTDLTVRQRTYVVNGQSAYLIVYTIVNDTSRVFPLVEASMMADFDIPPLSYDTATDFDPTSQMVMLYDTIPYTDPEEHYWFGLAPASAGAPVAGQFGFANWNLDKNMTLAQFGSSATQDNRYRFLLWDPALSGDHDDAVGKSEKQGAISMLLGGPLFPGDQRSVAFCYAAGEGGSNAAARAELTALMTGCRAIYTAVTPSCGDGVLQYPEECDGGADCASNCLRIRCGDGRVDGPEECDDGGDVDGDGCNATCQREVCGNGRLDAGEECDDGNASNADECLADCTNARCGDGFVRAGDGPCTGPGCGCAGYEYCLTGRVTIERLPASSYFASLSSLPIDFQIGFDAATVDAGALAGEGGVRVTTGPMNVEMSGAPLAATIGRALTGQSAVIDLRSRPLRTNPVFSMSRIEGTVGRGTRVGFELLAATSADASFVTARGVPVLSTLNVRSGTGRFSVVPASGGAPSDTASGVARASMGSVPAGMAGELCDDGNASDFDACTTACVPAACGDGIVQTGEQCDVGPTPTTWCVGCARVGSTCGNGVLEATEGEECDDANATDGDGCSAVCRVESCGDGIVQAGRGEACDDGGNGDGDGCSDACELEGCGDGNVHPGLGEACDDGPANGDDAACTSACAVAECGDGLVLLGVEECDDGNDAVGDGCNAACVIERCGDGAPGPGEECDDGNADERDGCSPACRFEICGDGRPGPAEQCDDGNLSDGDGCDKDCLLEDLGACGDGVVGTGEQCDDGGTASGDGCGEFCQLEDPEACGDGTLGAGEGCDDGNTVGGDGCSPVCTVERCGDGIQARGEQCDDGNDRSGDGCSSNCVVEPSECGNGRQEYGEQCDGGDDCDAECRATARAPLGETCGDGVQDYGEQCDDGGRRDGNGCDGTCQLEASVCGNARTEFGELCDDGNVDAGDGCSETCTLEGEEPPVPTPTPEMPVGEGCSCSLGTPGRPVPALLIAGLLVGVTFGRRRRR
ncbi:MAG: DUF4215 domain-containing protein [Sandaracinaceae bacterium]|nr:DUF4215 domain-containing protein [Sandaracinaceae bacterium]